MEYGSIVKIQSLDFKPLGRVLTVGPSKVTIKYKCVCGETITKDFEKKDLIYLGTPGLDCPYLDDYDG